MLSNITRRLFALLVAVLVVCSFVAVPVAGASGGTSLGDSFDGSSSSTDSDSTDSDDESSDDTDDTSSTEDTESDDDGGEGDDGDDSSTDETDDGDTSTDDGDGDDENATDKIRNTVDNTTDALEESTDTTTDTVDDTTDTVEDTVDDTTGTVETTTEESVKTLSLGESLVSPTSTDPADVSSLQLSTDESLQLDGADGDGTDDGGADSSRSSLHETAVADADDADDGHTVVATTNTGGGQPIPNAPTGGAAISISLLAAMAALRTTPLVAGGVPTLGSIGASISTPAILSKLRPFVFPLRYSRYDDSDPLEHEAREDVYEIVNESPGAYLSEVSEEADLPLSTTRHHIKVLEREDLVSGAKLRGKRRFYPAYAEGVELAAALNDEATASIIDAIARLGSASVSDLADDIGRDPSTISHHLQRLEEDGIVTREREGRAVMNKLSGEARTALEPDSTPKPGTAGSAIVGGAD